MANQLPLPPVPPSFSPPAPEAGTQRAGLPAAIMLTKRAIGISDYSIREGRSADRAHPSRQRALASRLALDHHRDPAESAIRLSGDLRRG